MPEVPIQLHPAPEEKEKHMMRAAELEERADR